MVERIGSAKRAREDLCQSRGPELTNRATCYRRTDNALVAAIEVIGEANPQTIDAAAKLVQSLPEFETCTADRPTDLSNDAAEHQIAKAEVLAAAGQSAKALALIGEQQALVDASEEHSLRSRYYRLRGRLEQSQQQYEAATISLSRSAQTAVAAKRPRLATDAYIQLAIVVGYYQDQSRVALAHLQSAEAWLARSRTPALAGRLHDARGLVAASKGRIRDAVRAFSSAIEAKSKQGNPLGVADSLYYRGLLGRSVQSKDTSLNDLDRARELKERELGVGHPELLPIQQAVGLVHAVHGEPKQALAAFRKSVADVEAALGPNAPELASALNGLGTQLQSTGDYPGALDALKRSLSIKVKNAGSDDTDVARTQINIATVYYYQGKHADALPYYEAALVALSKKLGPNHGDVGSAASGVGLAALETGDLEKARRHLIRAVDVARGNENSMAVALALGNLGLVERAAGDLDAARAMQSEALALSEAELPPQHPDLAYPLSSLAEIHLEQGRLDEATSAIGKAMKIRIAAGVSPSQIAENRFVLAKIQWRQQRRKEARASAKQALRELGDTQATLRRAIGDWIAHH